MNQDNIDLINSCNVACVGHFDGVHLGHQALVKSALELGSPIAFVLNKHELLPLGIKLERLTATKGLVAISIPDFSSVDELSSYLLAHYPNLKHIVSGQNLRFSSKQEELVNSLVNFKLHKIESVTVDYHDVSTSQIHKYLKIAAVGVVNKILGYNFFITPISTEQDSVLDFKHNIANTSLADGVYCVKDDDGEISIAYKHKNTIRSNISRTHHFMSIIRPHREMDDIAFVEQLPHDMKTLKFVKEYNTLA